MTMTKKSFENYCSAIEAKQDGSYVGLTSLNENKTVKTKVFGDYFKKAFPNYVGMSIGNGLLNVVNKFIENSNSPHPKLAYSEKVSNNVYLIPVGDNILLHVKLVIVDLFGGGISKSTAIEGFIVNENATIKDVQLVIDLMK